MSHGRIPDCELIEDATVATIGRHISQPTLRSPGNGYVPLDDPRGPSQCRDKPGRSILRSAGQEPFSLREAVVDVKSDRVDELGVRCRGVMIGV